MRCVPLPSMEAVVQDQGNADWWTYVQEACQDWPSLEDNVRCLMREAAKSCRVSHKQVRIGSNGGNTCSQFPACSQAMGCMSRLSPGNMHHEVVRLILSSRPCVLPLTLQAVGWQAQEGKESH